MIGKDIKGEARKKLALNMHQAIIVYTVELTIFITLIALVVMSCVTLGSAISNVAAIVMICYGSILFIIAFVGSGMVNFAMTDFYLVSYKCQPYNIRRLGETIARSNITKVLLMCLKRTVIAFLLLLCLIVPGVIYLIRTSMASFLLIANPKMKPSAALTASNKVMSGKTGSYFALYMSLIGWYILGIATLGLGFIFIAPYINLVKTVFYKRNLQGDKGAYTVSPQALASVTYSMSQPARQPITGQMSSPSQPMPQVPIGPAPVDALTDEDVMDMNAAINDFGGGVADSVPEVPLAPPTGKKEKPAKTKLTREEKRLAKEAAKQEQESVEKQEEKSHRIDGTGLVETERVLTTQELDASDALARTEIEHMYSNAERERPTVNYFDINNTGNNTDDFEDDFGVTPITDDEPQPVVDEQPIIEPLVEQADFADTFGDEPIVQTEPIGADEPVMSDSEFDEFLRNFDSEQPTDDAFDVDIKDEQNADTENEPTTTLDKRRLAEERIERDRKAAAERLAKARQHTPSHELSDRAERIRREREERLKNLNNKK
ncbi:MAG: DUF975 family protein [Clostridiales bacterium]|nr:DUF975 family protein [Clostridiales bacterium]